MGDSIRMHGMCGKIFVLWPAGQIISTQSTTPNITMVSDKGTSAITSLPSFFQSTQLNTNFLDSSPSPKSVSAGFTTSVLPTMFSSTAPPMTTKSFQTFQPSSLLSSDGYHSSISSLSSTSSSSMDLSTYPFTFSSSVNFSVNGTHGQPPSGKEVHLRGRDKLQFINLKNICYFKNIWIFSGFIKILSTNMLSFCPLQQCWWPASSLLWCSWWWQEQEQFGISRRMF